MQRWHVPDEGRGTPDVDADTAYFLSRRDEVVSVDIGSGRVRWRARLGGLDTELGGSRVVVSDGMVMAGGHDLVGIDASTGERRWAVSPVDAHGAGFYLGDARGALVYTGSASGVLQAVAASTGRRQWTVEVGTPSTTVYVPVVSADLVAAIFLDFEDRSHSGVVVVDAVTGRERWRRRLPSGVNGGAVAAGGPVFSPRLLMVTGQDGGIHAFDRTTGVVVWSRPADASAAPDFPAPAIVDDVLVVGSLSGDVAGYDAGSGVEIWRHTPVRASVAFVVVPGAGTVYVPYVSGTLVALSAADGLERWRRGNPGTGLRWPPRVRGSRLYLVGSSTGFFSYEERLPS